MGLTTTVNEKVRKLGFKSLRDYIGQRAHYTLSEMAEELGVPVSSFRAVHSDFIREKVENETR